MPREIVRIVDKRWGIAVQFEGSWLLLGRCCWPSGASDVERVPTFATRREAREAKELLTSYREQSRVVPIDVIIQGR